MFSRHELVWLSSQGWLAARAAALPGQLEAFERWQRADWPLVVRRNDPGMGADSVSLGLALPPDADGRKVRIALRALRSDVSRSLPALALDAVHGAAPAAWKAGLAALDAQAQGLAVRVYGSLALQSLTGQAYLTPASDIDLLFYPASVAQLQAGVALLSAHAALLPLDGEIVFPSGQAVAWKEWTGARHDAARVLAKTRDAVHLASCAALLATLEDA